MRLINAHVTGFGRLADAKANLDSKLVAFVGPNEAGKTTFLNALAFISGSEALGRNARSRSIDVTDNTKVVEVTFILDDQDRASLLELELEEAPLKMAVERDAAGGNVRVGISPHPLKSRVRLNDALGKLKKVAALKVYEDLLTPNTTYTDPGGDGARHYPTEMRELIKMLELIEKKDALAVDNADLTQRASTLIDGLNDTTKAQTLRESLEVVKEWGALPDPAPKSREILYSRMPKFLLFSDEDRTLTSSYALDETLLTSPAPAIRNIANMAGLDFNQLVEFTKNDDTSRLQTLLLQANNALARIFKGLWKQSEITISLRADATTLRVDVIENGQAVTVFDERSAGFRMFAALVTFLAFKRAGSLPILLIDEAESHLHIDAQADLVNMFVAQEEVAKVIYSTHSPACLPPDLGVGVRAVVPSNDGSQVSTISNSFWVDGAGYSPLMIAMGAGAAAFSTARYVVLAEGATEMLILPSLIRSVTALEILPYQIAPGLSEASPELYPSLDLEGAKVVYLTDGDGGGDTLRQTLIKSGVPEKLIVTLPVPGIENLLDKAVYLDAIKGILLEQYPANSIPEFPSLDKSTIKSWAKELDAWALANSLKLPSKIAVANRIVEQDKAKPDSTHVATLQKLHEDISKALKIE